jgi:hypothetical protein
MNWRRTLCRAVLGGTMILGGMTLTSLPARADACSKVREERFELNQAIRYYGYYSWQADQERRDLARAEARCGYGYGYRSSPYVVFSVPVYRSHVYHDWDHRRDDRDFRRHDRDDRRDRDRRHDRDRDWN